MADIYNTQYFNVETDPEMRVKKVLELVYVAMTEKGYNPVNQIVGYIISGDPTYITSHKNARSMIMKVERRTQLPVILWDERLTTVAADRVMDETGVRNHKDYVDEIAAMLILQGYLDRVNAGLPVPEVKIDEE